VTEFFQELFQTGLYKRSQGRITRQVTFGALLITALLGYWSLMRTLADCQAHLRLGLPLLLCTLTVWVAYRAVNLPAFADFLIAVEAEMNKVSWPTRHELFRASVVVLFTIFVLAGVLYFFDAFWQWFFSFLHIIS
jgi:preprotein translocase subunit SecE